MRSRSCVAYLLIWTVCGWLPAWAAMIPLVNHSDVWHYRKGTNQPQADWKLPGAVLDGTWLTGPGGFGFGTDAQETNNCQTILTDMRGSAATNYTTLYIRKSFFITNPVPSNLHLVLRMDWDDGYMAWLDGVRLTNALSPNPPNEPPYNAVATGNHECSTGQAGSNPQPAVTNDLGPVGTRLAPGEHVLAIMGLNVNATSGDFILVADLFLDEVATPPPPTNAVGGLISADTTWYASNGVYTVTNTVTVASNVTLTIEPGVTVRFRQGTGLTVRGRLLAVGTPSQRITFTREPGATTWERIMFIKAAESRLEHCVIEFSNCVGDHKDYYPISCGPPPVYGPRNYHEAVVVLASHVTFESCAFTNLPNTSATAEGDALAIISDDPQYPGPASAVVRNCHFIRIGQGVHTRFAYVLVEGCVFQDKHGDNDDVDLYGESDPPSVIRNNLFLYPSYDDRINPTRCSAIIYGNTIYGSTDHGIVLRDVGSPIVFNNVLYSCSAGGISVQNGCTPIIAHNTLVNCNRAIKLFDHLDRINPPYCLSAASGRATLFNNIIWNSTPAFDLSGNAFGILTVDVSWSDIQGGTNNVSKRANAVLIGGPGNFDADPLFVNAAATNFHLRPGSPCLDAGTNLSALVRFDFDGLPRPLDSDGVGGPGFDVGAYELMLPSTDSNGDGIPDGWCWQFGLSPVDPDVAAGNPDADPHTTYQEWIADTDPTNAQSFFRLERISLQGPVTISFRSSAQRHYTLLACTNLTQGAWTPVPGQINVPGNGAVLSLVDPEPGSTKFYRVQVAIPPP